MERLAGSGPFAIVRESVVDRLHLDQTGWRDLGGILMGLSGGWYRSARYRLFSDARYPVIVAVGLLAVIVVGVTIVTFAQIAYGQDNALRLVGGAGILIVLLVLQGRHCQLALGGSGGWRRIWTLPAQIVLTYAPLTVFAASWLAISGLLAGSWLLLTPPAGRWLGFTIAVAAQIALSFLLRDSPIWLPVDIVSMVAIGLLLYGIVRLARLAGQDQATRMQLVQVAVAGERERFVRDLHDLLGHRLSVIVLKGEVARRIVRSDPYQADLEVADILRAARDAQADVRAVAHGYPTTSLQTEFTSLHAVLEAAGVRSQINVSCGEVPTHLGDLLGKVLREGVTNLLRHSAPRVCEVELIEHRGHLTLSLSNDGVLTRRDRGQGGAGIRNLRDRAAEVGGRVSAGLGSDGRFHLVVEIPLDVESDQPTREAGA